MTQEPPIKGLRSVLPPPSLQAASPSATKAIGAPQEFDTVLSPGKHVTVRRLRNACKHNGKEGVLISSGVKDSVKRWNLRLLTGELLALKPENLHFSGGAPSMQAMVEALDGAGEHDKAAMLRSILPG